MLAIRLSRVGRKNRPSYRVIVSEKSRDTLGISLEILGFYDPILKTCDLKKERIEHWLKSGAKPSFTVHNLLVDKNIMQGPKLKFMGKKKSEKEAEKEKSETTEKKS